ncbi:hypothetical protein LINPERPRIM_LOCUS6841 [Linum perenne]
MVDSLEHATMLSDSSGDPRLMAHVLRSGLAISGSYEAAAQPRITPPTSSLTRSDVPTLRWVPYPLERTRCRFRCG